MKNNTNKTCRWLSPDFPVGNLPDLFLRIWHSHLHAACANHYIQRPNTKESTQVSQDIFIFINEVILSTRFNCTNTLEKTWFLWVRPLILEWSCAKHCQSCQWLTASSPHRLLLSPAPKMTLLLLLHQLHLHLNFYHHLRSAPVGQRYHLKSTFPQLFFSTWSGGRVGQQLVEGDYVSRNLSDFSPWYLKYLLHTWCIG